ncbi:hypothetical protein [Clostridium saudiense]|nr:hypothetical protein [Clostridium saudiense]
MEIICLYKYKYNGKINEKKFDSYEFFGKWIADNTIEISIIDVIQEED